MWKKMGIIFKDNWAQLPVVDDSYKDMFRVYYSKRINNKSYPMFFDINKNNIKNIIYKETKPILKLGNLGFFDQAGVMPAEIINFNDKKYMYYIGWTNRVDIPYHNSIGLAISNDNGKTFCKHSKGPVLGTSWKEPGFTGTISVLLDNGIWRAWYLSCREWRKISKNKPEPIYDIKYAESKDGINWDPKNITSISLSHEESGISQASVIKNNNKSYSMWFSYRKKFDYRTNKNNSYKIGFAKSCDGINWERSDVPALDISDSGWDSEMVAYPYVINYKNQKIMFYNGNGFGKSGVGYAVS